MRGKRAQESVRRLLLDRRTLLQALAVGLIGYYLASISTSRRSNTSRRNSTG